MASLNVSVSWKVSPTGLHLSKAVFIFGLQAPSAFGLPIPDYIFRSFLSIVHYSPSCRNLKWYRVCNGVISLDVLEEVTYYKYW